MLIDRKSIPWVWVTAVIAAVSIALYLWDAPRHISGHGGSTPLGLTFGGAALAIMLFCAALGLKRRVPHWRLGRAQTWLRGHIWLGFLVVLLVALHAAFRAGGMLTTWLWALLAFVTVSGVLGVILQQLVPSLLHHSVPGETVAQQLDRQLASLTQLADEIIIRYAGSLDKPAPMEAASDTPPGQTDKPPYGAEPLRMFYAVTARGYLNGGIAAGLDSPTQAQVLFASLRTVTPPHIHPSVDAIEQLCDRRRQLLRQRLFMRLLTAWLIVHVPLSWVLLLLSVGHAIVALRYGS